MFIRRFKLFALGIDRRIPEKLTRGDLVQVKVAYLAKDLEIPRSKLRIKGDFDNKSRKNTISDDPEVILKVRNFFELPEHSSQGDRVRNMVKMDGIDVHRRYLRQPIHSISMSFLKTNSVRCLSISTIKKIVKNNLKHLTIPTKRLVYK